MSGPLTFDVLRQPIAPDEYFRIYFYTEHGKHSLVQAQCVYPGLGHDHGRQRDEGRTIGELLFSAGIRLQRDEIITWVVISTPGDVDRTTRWYLFHSPEGRGHDLGRMILEAAGDFRPSWWHPMRDEAWIRDRFGLASTASH